MAENKSITVSDMLWDSYIALRYIEENLRLYVESRDDNLLEQIQYAISKTVVETKDSLHKIGIL